MASSAELQLRHKHVYFNNHTYHFIWRYIPYTFLHCFNTGLMVDFVSHQSPPPSTRPCAPITC